MRIEGQNRTGIMEAAVGEDKRLWVESNTIKQAAFISKEFGDLWTWLGHGNFDAADTWILVQNNDPNKILRIQSVEVYSDTATLYQIHCPVPAVFAGDAIDPICLNNPTTEKLPSDIAFEDETANAQANVIKESYLGANGSHMIYYDGMIILNYLESIAVDFTADVVHGISIITGWFENKNGSRVNI